MSKMITLTAPLADKPNEPNTTVYINPYSIELMMEWELDYGGSNGVPASTVKCTRVHTTGNGDVYVLETPAQIDAMRQEAFNEQRS